jgi:hypothetical protein
MDMYLRLLVWLGGRHEDAVESQFPMKRSLENKMTDVALFSPQL